MMKHCIFLSIRLAVGLVLGAAGLDTLGLWLLSLSACLVES